METNAGTRRGRPRKVVANAANAEQGEADNHGNDGDGQVSGAGAAAPENNAGTSQGMAWAEFGGLIAEAYKLAPVRAAWHPEPAAEFLPMEDGVNIRVHVGDLAYMTQDGRKTSL